MVIYHPEKIHRVIIKISGEFLAGPNRFGYHHETINQLVEDIISVKRLGLSVGIVVGGGNIYRGSKVSAVGVTRVAGDNIGMLATIQNSLVLCDYLKKRNYIAELYSAIQIDKISKFYTPLRAETSLKEGKICLFCAGTGNPYFTTDTAVVLRAIELKANLVLKGTKVNGVYSADPEEEKDATFFEDITYDELLNKKLNVMDMTAFSLARDNNQNIKIFNITKSGNLKEAILKKNIGTFIHS